MRGMLALRIALPVFIAGLAFGRVVWCSDPVTVRVTTTEELVNEEFGAFPAHSTLIAGINIDGLVKSIVGPEMFLARRNASLCGVWHIYKFHDEDVPAPLTVTIGVYGSEQVANCMLVAEVKRSSAGWAFRHGLGDRAFSISGRRALVLVNNAFLSVHANGDDAEELVEKVVCATVKELDSGTTYVTRASSVPVPEVVSVGLPERVRLGKRARGAIVIRGIDPSKALLGCGLDDRLILREGPEPEVIYDPPDAVSHAGTKKFTICVVTPENVIATKEISVVVN